MARRVFFSFDYERDKWRAGQVRNSWVTKPDGQTAGFWDAAAWEKLKKKGDVAVKRWIDNQLLGTSVTVVLVGARTATRKWVKYEIKRSIEAKKGLLGIWIHNVKDQRGRRDVKGDNPLDQFYVLRAERQIRASSLYQTHDWVYGDGYQNLNRWVEEAARSIGR